MNVWELQHGGKLDRPTEVEFVRAPIVIACALQTFELHTFLPTHSYNSLSPPQKILITTERAAQHVVVKLFARYAPVLRDLSKLSEARPLTCACAGGASRIEQSYTHYIPESNIDPLKKEIGRKRESHNSSWPHD